MVVHPEVGKWLIGLGEKLFGFTPLGWRVVPAIDRHAADPGDDPVRTPPHRLDAARLRRRADPELRRPRVRAVAAGPARHLRGVLPALRGALPGPRPRLVPRPAGRPGPRSGPTTTAGGRCEALLFRPWLLVSGICWGLACGSKWEAIYPLAAFGILVVAWCAGARRSFGVSFAGPKSLLADGVPAFVHLVLVGLVVYVATWTGWLMHSSPVRRVPLRHAVHPLRLRRLGLRQEHHLRQLQALADRRPAGQARPPRPRPGSRVAVVLPPRRLRLPHPLPQRLHPHLRLAAARLAAAQPPGRRRRPDRHQARHRRLRRPAEQRLPAAGAPARHARACGGPGCWR